MMEKPIIFNGGITAALCSSRAVISPILSCSEYSANNAYNYNGNNGNLNNNNKNNTNSCRRVAELKMWRDKMESLPFPLSEFYQYYRITRKNKGKKASHLIFNLDYPQHLRELCIAVNEGTYTPTTSIVFIITKPKVREVIAADFRDRVVQTLFVQEMLPYFEEYEHPDSYSCRVEKGSLAAVAKLKQINDKYRDGYVCFLDIKNHFMSIDTELWTPRLQAFIAEKYPKGERRDILVGLAETIYRHKPQEDCIKVSPAKLWDLLPPEKSAFNSTTGLPIGNVTSQALSNFITTGYLRLLESMGFDFAFYTDDTGLFSMSKEKIFEAMPIVRDYLRDECHLTLHPNKIYLQPTRHGFNALGHRIKKNNDTPSKRNVHNFHLLINHALKLAENPKKLYGVSQRKIMERINSYLALLGWSHSWNIRKREMTRLHNSPWAKVFRFPAGIKKVEIKPMKSTFHYFVVANIRRRKTILKQRNYDTTRRTFCLTDEAA